MGSEAIALIRKGYELFNRQLLEPYLELFDPDIEFVLTAEATPSPQTLRGHAGVSSFARDIWRTFDDFHISVFEIEELTEEWYLASLVLRGKIKGTSAEVNSPFLHLINMRGGRARQLRVYTERKTALRDPELSAARPRRV
jgi:ketosteroid isomerase-like protein